ncbi:winged helix-turn-helix transcriptional regulator [Cetobacterium somerae]|uniref:winged helix-turn-helix transcriptional regulator n=1 Tax=Cetobacterium somerae TaxID=188913 RepID=UPI00389234C8
MKTKDKILKRINENPGVTSIELSKEFFQTKGNISIHLKKLEKEASIKKYPLENNRKLFKLHPTKQGKEIYLKMKLEALCKKI